MKRTRLIYLAQPYTHPDPYVVRQRVLTGARVAGRILTSFPEFAVHAPIAHTHEIAMVNKLPTEWDWWRDLDFAMIDRCDEVWVLTIDGWKESRGVTAEIAYATENGIPVEYIEEDLGIAEFREI